MRLVVSDTGPVNYLVLIGCIDLLPRLFGRVVLPEAVRLELASPFAPLPVQQWIATPPAWVEILDIEGLAPVEGCHPGEGLAIAMAVHLSADLLLMDDRRGVASARSRGLRVTGTLGVLDLAAERNWIDFALAVHSLERTSFRRPTRLLDTLIKKHEDRRRT